MPSRREFLVGVSAIPLSWNSILPQAASVQSANKDWPAVRELLSNLLLKNILPFWYPQTLDRDRGGYLLNHDIQGRSKGSSNKDLVVQSRCVWFYSHLYRMGYGSKEHLDAARLGFEFLRDKMWDKQFGGFYWEVDVIGNVATMADKHLYGQAFGLYALSEYYMASGDEEAFMLARKLFGILEYFAYDTRYGGYIESFHRDWSAQSNVGKSYMDTPHDLKLMNTHLHLMEALTTYYLAGKDQVARERLVELIIIQSNSVLRKKLGACTDRHYRNWTPLRGPSYDRVSYGHDLENIWLMMDACKAAGVPDGPLLDFYVLLFAYSYQYGFDQKQGGFFYSGAFNNMADQRGKEWWVQAETLVSSLRMYQTTHEDFYLNCFHRVLDWIDKRQADWENGDWFATIPENGPPVGDKAHAWKGPYHNGRAMMECLEIVKAYS